MNTKILIAALTTLCLAACSKDKFNTKPTLEFKSTNSTVFQKGQLMEFVLRYTDKEGDIQNSLYLEEVTKVDCSGNNFNTTYPVPTSLPLKNNSEGDIVVNYIYATNSPTGVPPTYPGAGCQKNDTCYFRFALTDKANNTSDTVTSPQIVLVY
ncbi:MAG: hypothetical protein ABI921_05255 [Panacibacter sp.]